MNWQKIKEDYFQTDQYSTVDMLAAVAASGIGVFIATQSSQGIDVGIGIFGTLAVVTRLNSKVPLVFASICALSMPLAQILELRPFLESLAIYTFYFLLIGIGLAALEMQPHRARKTASLWMWRNKQNVPQKAYVRPQTASQVEMQPTQESQKTPPATRATHSQRKVKRRTQPVGVIDPVFSTRS